MDGLLVAAPEGPSRLTSEHALNTVNPDFLSPSASRLHPCAKPKYLHKRGGRYYFKRKIPADVAHGFPAYTEQVWKSLGTTLLHRAKVYLAVEVTEFDLRVTQLRKDKAEQFGNAVGYASLLVSTSRSAGNGGQERSLLLKSNSTASRPLATRAAGREIVAPVDPARVQIQTPSLRPPATSPRI